MSNHGEEDLDLLLSLGDRVLETPPHSPTTAHPNSTDYASDDERRRTNEDADMSVFKSAVEDCMDYDTEAARKALKSKSVKISNEAGTEKYSGLRIRKQLVSPAELSNQFADTRFIRLPNIKKLIAGETLTGCWATVGVLAEKGTPKKSSIGKTYVFWKIGCLDEQTISIFLFGNAYQRYCDEPAGTVFAFFNASVKKESMGGWFSLSVATADQILKIGTSVDYGVCKGKRKDGMACTMMLNRRHGMYCSYHRSKTSKEYSNVRSVLQGGNLKTAFRDHLRSQGIYMVNRLPETTAKQPMKLLSVEKLKKALSNGVNMTTNTHSQGLRFLNQVTDKMSSKNEPARQTGKSSGAVKRTSPTLKTDSCAMRSSQGAKRVKAEPLQVSSEKSKESTSKMVELDIISSSDEETY